MLVTSMGCCVWCPAERAEQEAADAAQLLSQCGSEDDGFLRFLAASYLSRGKNQQALQCLQRLTVLAPGRITSNAPLLHKRCSMTQCTLAQTASWQV